MTLWELFDRLATGELSQHKYGKTGSIQEGDYPALINQLNIALSNLYGYFPLSVKETFITQVEGTTEYTLMDILRIEGTYDEEGNEVPLNDKMRTDSWFTPSWNVLKIPEPVEGNIAVVAYRAKPEVIAQDADVSTEILVPACLEEALQAYIASRCFVSLGNQASASLASYYTNRYNEQVQWVERNNLLQSSTGDSNIKLSLKGFI